MELSGTPGGLLARIFRPNIAGREERVRRQLLALPAGWRLLDAGCGGQPYARYCQHLHYVAQDFCQLDAATQIVGGHYGTVDVVSDIADIPLGSASFDTVLCTEALEHVPDPNAAVREFGRLLKPGGVLILTAPLGSFIHQEPFHFCSGFSPYWYEHYLPRYGFAQIEIVENGGFFVFFSQECQRFTRTLFRGRPIRSLYRLLLLPLEILSILVFTILLPATCFFLDKAVPTRGYTVGYHVKAVKQ